MGIISLRDFILDEAFQYTKIWRNIFRIKIGKKPISWLQFSGDYSTQLIDSGFDRDGIDNAEYQYALKTLFVNL